VREQTFAQVRQVAVGIAGGRDAFVHLHDVDIGPRNSFVGQRAQHLPWRAATAHGHDKFPAHRDRRARFSGDNFCGGNCHGFGVGKDFYFHAKECCQVHCNQQAHTLA